MRKVLILGALAALFVAAQYIPPGGASGASSITSGALASLPSTPCTNGNQYLTTNAVYSFFCKSTAWQAYFGTLPVTPPVAANFTWVNQGSATVTSANGPLVLNGPPNGSSNLRLQVASAPGTAPWNCIFLIGANVNTSNSNSLSGVVLRESGTGKIQFFGMVGPSTIIINHWSSPTGFVGQDATFAYVPNNGMWIKATFDGTNVIWYLSADQGFTWNQYLSVAATTPFTTAPNQCGTGYDSEGSGGPNQTVSLIHYSN